MKSIVGKTNHSGPTNIKGKAPINDFLSSQYRIIEVCNLADLSKYKQDWNNLAFNSPPYLPNCSYAWVASYFEHFSPGNESWVCWLAYKEKQLVGVLPLISVTNSTFGYIWHKLKTPINSETLAVSPLLEKGLESIVLDLLLTAAWTSRPNTIYITMPDISAKAAIEPHASKHKHLRILSRTGRYLKTDGSQKQFQLSLSKNFRSNQRKSFNKLSKLIDIQFEFITDTGNTNAHLSDYTQVEALSWKGREGTAIECSDKMLAFYISLTRRLSEAGWLEWQYLRTDGKTIAANLTVRFNRTILLWKLGYDDSFAHCSPGGLLFQKLLDSAFEDNEIDEIDLLTNASWYDNWKMEERKYYEFRFYNKKSLSSIIFGYRLNKLVELARKSDFLRTIAKIIRRR